MKTNVLKHPKKFILVLPLLLLLLILSFYASLAQSESIAEETSPVKKYMDESLNNPQEKDRYLHFKNGKIDPMIQKPVTKIPTLDVKSYKDNEKGQYLVQFNRGKSEVAKKNLESIGAEIFGYFPNNAFRVRMTNQMAQHVSPNSMFRSTIIFPPEHKISSELKDLNGTIKLQERNNTNVDLFILVWSLKDKSEVKNLIQSLNGQIIESDSEEASLTVRINRSAIDEITLNNSVVYIQETGDFKLTNERTAAITLASSPWSYSKTGAGEIIAVADTGLDTGDLSTLHPAFQNKTVGWLNYGTAWRDTNGHGTHVAGVALGSGAQSTDNNKKGIAYGARLLVQNIINSDGTYAFPALTTLYGDAWNNGARISNNSWARTLTNTTADYDGYAYVLDKNIWDRQDWDSTQNVYKKSLNIITGAGNEEDNNPGGQNIVTPATAKNSITVGATKTDRDGQSPYEIAHYSSRGPTSDGRIKPDIVAPGGNGDEYSDIYKNNQIVSTRSQISSRPAWGNSFYTSTEGTSAAAPAVSGAAALVRQYYKNNFNIVPSSSLVKATLINGATRLTSRYSLPGNIQGWGLLNLRRALYPTSYEGDKIKWSDALSVGQGEVVEYKWNITRSDGWFSTSLVWSDYPGDPSSYDILVNKLHLTLISPSGNTYLATDVFSDNNVQQVFLDTPEVGTWTAKVSGYNIAYRQPFSLVTRGGF